jgi:hypothetical protein
MLLQKGENGSANGKSQSTKYRRLEAETLRGQKNGKAELYLVSNQRLD